MSAPSIDVKDMLVAESALNLEFAVNLFIGREPATPVNCVTIFDTPGFPQSLSLDSAGSDYQYPSVQIRVRNVKYTDGWNLLNSIVQFLHSRAGETWGGALYTVIYCVSGPALLDWDDNNNARIISNFNLQRR